jgi:protoporphyrinogen oxidase
MGLAVARRLALKGCDVTVLERGTQLGGLTTHHEYGSFTWDRFYHVVAPTDRNLAGFLGDLGLADALQWRRARTGFYIDGKFHSLSNSWEFLTFPALSLFGKFRLALTIMGGARINNWRRLEGIPVAEWLRRWSGRETFERIWKPLLLAKLGDNYKRVSAVFIWSYIKRIYGAREAGAGREMLGYVSGGYKVVFDRLRSSIESRGGKVKTGIAVSRISEIGGSGIQVDTDKGRLAFDKVIFTGPVGALRQVADPKLLHFEAGIGEVDYLGVVCGVVVSEQPLVPYYTLNIADATIPFTGIIGMSSLVDTAETAGLYLTYLPKYVDSQDPILRSPDQELAVMFRRGLEGMFGDLERFGIQQLHINRAARVQPLQVLDYSSKVPRVQTEHPDFYTINTAQFVCSSLNNNEVVRLVENFIDEHGQAFAATGARQPDTLDCLEGTDCELSDGGAGSRFDYEKQRPAVSTE